MKEDWKYVLMEFGVVSVMMVGIKLMHMLHVNS